MREISYKRPNIYPKGLLRAIAADAGYEGCYVFEYLCHGPASNMYALYRLSLNEAAEDLGMQLPDIRDALLTLAESGHIGWDSQQRIVYIPGEFRRQCGSCGVGEIGSKHLTGAQRQALTMIDSPLALKFLRDHGLPIPPSLAPSAGAEGREVSLEYRKSTDRLSENGHVDGTPFGGKVA